MKKEDLRKFTAFSSIDFHFADYLIKKEQAHEQVDLLYTIAVYLSHYANQQHSVLPIQKVDGMNLSEFLNSDDEADLKLDFSNYIDWSNLFPKSIGDTKSNKPLILDLEKGLLYLNKYYRAEESIVEFIKGLNQKHELSTETQQKLKEVFPIGDKPQGTDWQELAAFVALRNSFSVITGGPGTGKTTTVGRVLALLLSENPKLKIDLLAPTGKAADRLGGSIKGTKASMKAIFDESFLKNIPESATTIHRYLQYHGGSKEFRKNSQNKTSSDLVLIDEASMVSLPMFRSLLSALKEGCRVILLGDKDQLTAVETGNVLGDLTSMKNINHFSAEFCEVYSSVLGESFSQVDNEATILTDSVVKLEHSRRFTADSAIGRLASLVNDADESTTFEDLSLAFNFKEEVSLEPVPESFIEAIKAQNFFREYKDLLKSQSDDLAREVLQKLDEFRILCPTRSGELGSEYLNEQISKEVFSEPIDQSLYHGRCIMILQNNKELELYNGDVGVILVQDEIPRAYFQASDGKLRSFKPTILPNYETAFAMTIHKSQGSEYDKVLIPIASKDSRILSKELLYTGITRAKKSVKVYSDLRTVLKMSQRKTERFSGLLERLKG